MFLKRDFFYNIYFLLQINYLCDIHTNAYVHYIKIKITAISFSFLFVLWFFKSKTYFYIIFKTTYLEIIN